MKTKHTPGPWKLAMHATAYRAVESTHTAPAAVVCEIKTPGIENPIANAHLIAAAPELLAALAEVAGAFSRLMQSNGARVVMDGTGERTAGDWAQGNGMADAIFNAHAAISKATGRG